MARRSAWCLQLIAVIAACAAAAFGAPGTAQALLVDMSVEDMTLSAQAVVLADTVSTSARRVMRDGRPTVETVVKLRRDSTLKGEPPADIEIVLPGGEADGLGVWVSDSPVFVPGRRCLVFLDRDGGLVGGAQGRLDVAGGMVDGAGQPWQHVRDRVLFATGRLIGPVLTEPIPAVSAQGVTAAAPVITDITPGSASAGTGSRVTITGSGFGASRGTGSVGFFYRSGRPTIPGSVVSWNDTSIVVEVPVGYVSGYPASAGSGPVTVTNGSGATSPGHDFEVTFGYGNLRWADTTVGYRVSAPDPAFETMVDEAAATWSSVSAFQLVDEGTSAPSSQANDVYWTNLSDGYLGQAYISYVPGSPGQIVRCDFVFNTDYAWGDGSGDTYDVQSVAVHELGHWLNLRDLYGPGDTAEVMYGVGTRGAQRRALHPHDLEGIVHIYGPGWVGVDSRAPTSTASGPPAGWATAPVTLTLTAEDDLSGVWRTYYRVGAGAIGQYPGPVTFAGDTSQTVSYWSVDRAGNVEDPNAIAVRVDTTDPRTEHDAKIFYGAEATVTLYPTDAMSGVASTVFSLDGGPAVEGRAAHTDVLGSHELAFRSTDAAGNSETTRTVRFTVVEPGETVVRRVSGSDRYATAVEASKRTYGTAGTVVLATGSDFADALSASGLAGALDAPLLLSRPDVVPDQVAAEIARLEANDVVVVGGARAVSDEAMDGLAQAIGVTWRRVAGADRYETAAEVAAEIASATGRPAATVFLVRGDGFADALAASPFARSLAAPVLLTRPDAAPIVTVAAAQASGAARVTVVGGTVAVSDGAAAALGMPWTRVSGANRYDTAIELVRHGMGEGWTVPEAIGIATGERFPDALSGGVAIGARNGAVILTPRDSLTPGAVALMDDTVAAVRLIEVYGGESAVSAPTYDTLTALAAP